MVKKFPKLEHLSWRNLGTSIVSLGLGLGSGEFILWPFLTVTYGYGILWGALLGISVQLLLILEIQRYTSVKGEDFVSGLFRLNRYLPLLMVLFGIIGFGWPGFAASSALLLNNVVTLPNVVSINLPVLLLIVCAGVLLIGRNVYSKIELMQTAVVIFSFLLIMLIFSAVVDFESIKQLTSGLIGRGDGYSFLPKDIDLGIFVGAVAYAGTGGILLLSQSFYTIEEGLGMTKYQPKLSLWNSKIEEHLDITPDEGYESIRNFKKLRLWQIFENGIFFWGLGILTIIGVSSIAYLLLKGVTVDSHSLQFLLLEADSIGMIWGEVLKDLFILVGVSALLSVQLGVYDITGRITVSVLRKLLNNNGITNGSIYTYSILIQLFVGILIFTLGFREPLWLLLTGAIINAVCMAVIAICTVLLNTKVLPKKYRGNVITYSALILSALAYIIFFVISL